MKKRYILILILIISVIVVLFFYLFNKEKMSDIQLTRDNINGQYSDITINDFNTAKKSLEEIQDRLNIKSVNDELQEDKMNTGMSTNTYKFKQIYNGLEVYQKGLIVYSNKDGVAKGIINDYIKIEENFNTVPQNTSEQLEDVVKNKINELGYTDYKIKENNLIIYVTKEGNAELAYIYTIDVGMFPLKLVISDSTKEILSQNTIIYDAKSSKPTVTMDDIKEFKFENVYKLVDKERNIKVHYAYPNTKKFELYQWNTLEEANNLNVDLGMKTLKTVQKAYDYFYKKFGHKSMYGNGKEEILVITGATISGDNNVNMTDNAFFSATNSIVLGADNLFNDDIEVMSHEYTHGIFYEKHGAGDEEQYIRAIINESYADIMGMCAEAYYNSSNTIDGVINGVNRKIKNANIKYQSIPRDYEKYKKEYITKDYFHPNKDEHYYSVVLSRAAYLMSKHMTLDEFERLWFNSMTLLPNNCDFGDCYYAVVKVAQNMNLTEEQQNEIKKAFKKVGISMPDKLIEENVNNYVDKKWTSSNNSDSIILIEATKAYEKYISDKKYVEDYKEYFAKENDNFTKIKKSRYCIFDVNQDGVPELIIDNVEDGYGEEFRVDAIYTYNANNKSVEKVELIHNYCGIRYEKNEKEIVYSIYRTTASLSIYEFYVLQNNKLEFSKNVVHDIGYNYVDNTIEYEERYCSDANDNKKSITEEEERAYFKNVEDFDYKDIEENSNTGENKGRIEAGKYYLDSGKYTDQYGTTYIINEDGTYTCTSSQSGEQYNNSGTYIIYNINDYEEEINQINTPIGFSGDWMIAFNYNNQDASKPYLIYSYNISENNKFSNAQTDEVWTYQGNT